MKGVALRGVVLIGILLLITGCNRSGPSGYYDNWEDNKYYRGYQGVEMRFAQQMPPNRIYYYGDTYDNTFDINVEVENQGTSWARGGIYVSGYDPNMIQIDGINPDPSQARACRLSIGNIGLGTFGGTLVCDNFRAGIGEGGYVELGMKNLFGSGGLYNGVFDNNKLFGSGVDFWYRRSGDDQKWIVDFNNPGIDVEYANHGRLLISMLQGIDFSRTFGVEYLLEGDTYEYPGGGRDYINFDGNVINWPPGLDSTTQTFLITNCYLYATYAAPVVCIDPAPFSENRKVCYPKMYTGTAGQGAPVAVTYIQQENTPRQSVFTIHIKNTGGGRVYDPGMLEICSPYSPARITGEELNVVYIGDIRVSGDLQRLDCTPHDYVRLDPRSGEGIVTCAYDIPFSGLKSAYQTPLVVELWYGYEKTIQKNVYIKRAI